MKPTRRDLTKEKIEDILCDESTITGKLDAIMEIIDPLVALIHAEAYQAGMDAGIGIFRKKKEKE